MNGAGMIDSTLNSIGDEAAEADSTWGRTNFNKSPELKEY